MNQAAFLVLLLPPLLLAMVSGRRFAFYLLLSGGIPVSMFMPGLSFLDAVGGISPQAAYLFVLVAVTWLALVLKLNVLVRLASRYLAITGFLLLAAASLSWSDDFIYGLRTLAKLSAPLLFFAVMLAFLRGGPDLRRAEAMVFLCCGLVLVLAVFNHYSGNSLGGANGTMWISRGMLAAPYTSPANFSFLMVCGALLALACGLTHRRRRYYLLYALFAGAVLWAFTRISMAGLVLGTALCILLLSRSRLIRLVLPGVLCLAFVAALFTVDSLRERMFYQTAQVDVAKSWSDPATLERGFNSSGRFYLWQEARKEFRHADPVLGAGAGAVDAWLSGSLHSELHSEFLRIYLELGWLGLSLYLLALLHFARDMLGALGHGSPPEVRKYAAAGLSTLACYGVTLATDNSLNYVTEFGLYVYAFLAFALVARREHARAGAAEAPVPVPAGWAAMHALVRPSPALERLGQRWGSPAP